MRFAPARGLELSGDVVAGVGEAFVLAAVFVAYAIKVFHGGAVFGRAPYLAPAREDGGTTVCSSGERWDFLCFERWVSGVVGGWYLSVLVGTCGSPREYAKQPGCPDVGRWSGFRHDETQCVG